MEGSKRDSVVSKSQLREFQKLGAGKNKKGVRGVQATNPRRIRE